MAVFQEVLNAVHQTIKGLALEGIDVSKDVRLQKLPWNRTPLQEGIVVSPVTEDLTPTEGTNERDDVGYGVQVTIIQASNEDLTTNADRFLQWRETIRKAFNQKALSGVASSYKCIVQPGPIYLPEAYAKNYDVQGLVIRVTCRESRS